MDSTLFDYKQGVGQDSRKNAGGRARPMSAQNQKFNYHGLPSVQENDAMRKDRPTTALNRGGFAFNDTGRNPQNQGMDELDPEEDARLRERANYAEPIQLQDVQRLIPRNIPTEKEKLYEDTLQLKHQINNLKEENLKMKTKNLNLERENAKLSKSIQKMGTYSASMGKPVESSIVVTLKKQNKELRDEIKQKNEELDAMKKNIKYTKFQELEIELKAHADENSRLRNMFEDYIKQKPQIKAEDYNQLEERYYMQVGMIETLQRDHARLSQEIKYLEEQNYNLQMTNDVNQKNVNKFQNENTRIKKQMQNKDKELLKLTQQLRYEPKRGSSPPKNDKSHDEDFSHYKRQIDQKDDQLRTKDRIIEDLKGKLNDRVGTDINEKEHMAGELQQLREKYADLEAKYQAVMGGGYGGSDDRYVQESKPRPTSGTGNRPQSGTGQRPQSGTGQRPQSGTGQRPQSGTGQRPQSGISNRPQSGKLQKLKRVTLDDVKDYGYELSLKLRIAGVELDDIMQFFDKIGAKELSVNDMMILMSRDPFNFRDDNISLLLARYFCEPGNEEYISFDINRTQSIPTIKTLFEKLVGNYELLEEKEEEQLAMQLVDIVQRYEESLKTQFSLYPESKSGYLSAQKLREAFQSLDINLNNDQFEYLIMNIFEYTGTLKMLDFNKIFEIFETEEHRELKQRMEKFGSGDAADYGTERSDKKVKFNDKKKSTGDGGDYEDDNFEEDYEEDYEIEDEQAGQTM